MLALMASSASRASSATTGSPRGSIRLAFSQSAELERLPDRTDSEMLPFEDACSYRGSSPMPALPPVPAPQPSVGCQTAVDWDLAAELLRMREAVERAATRREWEHVLFAQKQRVIEAQRVLIAELQRAPPAPLFAGAAKRGHPPHGHSTPKHSVDHTVGYTSEGSGREGSSPGRPGEQCPRIRRLASSPVGDDDGFSDFSFHSASSSSRNTSFSAPNPEVPQRCAAFNVFSDEIDSEIQTTPISRLPVEGGEEEENEEEDEEASTSTTPTAEGLPDDSACPGTLQREETTKTADYIRLVVEAVSEEAANEDVPPPAFLEAIRHHGGIGDAPPSDFTPFVTVAYGGDLIVNELAAPPAQRSSEGYLAPITSSFMDLDRLLAMDTHGLLGGVLDVIRSRESLESALVRDASSWHSEAIARGTSRRMLHHLPDLLKYGVAEVAHEHPRVVLPAFTVPKKSGGERFVCDGRKLNAVMPRPPPMLLPSMPDVIDRVLSSAVVYLADAKSYFYQFELDEGVRGYFGMNLAGPRGSFVRARLRAMCMGWSWAPAIAQRASRVILPETDGLPWVDNFVIVGDSLAEAEERFTRFARRCREVNCVLNDDEGQYGIPLTQFDLLGLRFDLASSPPRYSMATAWVEKLLRSSELAVFRGGVVSPRAFYRLFGAL
ncbi:hypothetical protein DIPPA_19707, partial [Diplonema papillatum]